MSASCGRQVIRVPSNHRLMRGIGLPLPEAWAVDVGGRVEAQYN